MGNQVARRGGPRKGVTAEQRAEETMKMLQLRQMGASYESIAKQFGLNRKTVWERITRYVRELPEEEAETLRAIEARKLDDYERRLQEKIAQGDISAIHAAARLSERRCRMLGIDLPQRHEVSIGAEESILAGQVVEALVELARADDDGAEG